MAAQVMDRDVFYGPNPYLSGGLRRVTGLLRVI